MSLTITETASSLDEWWSHPWVISGLVVGSIVTVVSVVRCVLSQVSFNLSLRDDPGNVAASV